MTATGLLKLKMGNFSENLLALLILFGLFLLIYARYRKQTLNETMQELGEVIKKNE